MGIHDAVFFFNKELPAKKLLMEILKNPKDQTLFENIKSNFFFKDELIIKGSGIDTYYKGEHIYYNHALGGFCAEKDGYAQMNGATIDIVDPVITLKKDLYGYLILPPLNGKQREFDYTFVLDILKARRIIHLVSHEAIKRGVDMAKQGTGIAMLVARGTPPVDGKEEELKLFFDLNAKAGKVKEDGTMDFRERERYFNVKKAQVIGEYIPAVKAQKGYDVYGNVIVPEYLPNEGYKPGKTLLIDGTTVKTPDDGIIVVDDTKRVNISPVLKIDKDVDLNTGNIKSDISVHVGGKINAGFKIEVGRDLLVDESIYNSDIRVGGNLRVNHGIIGEAAKTNIIVRGTMDVEHIENATIWCGGALNFSNSIINAKIQCGGAITGTGKGVIIGGSLFATSGIKALEIGSKSAVKTEVIVGIDLGKETKILELTKKLQMVEFNIAKMKISIGNDFFSDPDRLLKVPDEKFALIEPKMLEFFRLMEEKKNLDAELVNLRKALTNKGATIEIASRVYEGVVFLFGEDKCIINKSMSGPVTYFWDDKDKKIKFK